MKVTDVRDAMLLVLPNGVYHFQAADNARAPYIVWGEDGWGRMSHADNHMDSHAVQGTVDLFTPVEYDPRAEKVERALSLRGISYYLRFADYEKDTGLFHYQWVWEVA